jgi:outer membrane murein-binding lipoprotein Lpp
MNTQMLALTAVCAVCLGAGTVSAQAQPNAELQVRVQTLEEQVKQLKAELDALRGQMGAAPAAQDPTVVAPATAPVPEPPSVGGLQAPIAGSLPVYGAASAGSKIFNPDIGMIGNFISATGKSRGGSESIAPLPFATLQESEASFQAVVDPYARADFFLAIGEEGIEVEEGFVTFPTLPGGLLLKAGKMRANFGRLNAFHNHTLPWIDRPLAMYNLLGGSPLDPDTGIKDAGVSVARLIPAGKLFLEATGEVFRGDSGTVFKSNRRSDVSTIEHLRAYADFTEETNLEIGGSYARGHNEFGSDFVTQLYSTDATLRWRPLSRGIYRSVVARTELFWSRREEPTVLQRAFGGYASVDYGFRRRWFAGGRYDWAERAANASIQDRGASAVLTFWPSEFSQVRSQYRRTRYGDDGRVAHELLLQVLFTIGAHGAHPF